MGPVVAAPPATEGCSGVCEAVDGRFEPPWAKGKLGKRKRDCATVRDTVARLRTKIIAGIGAVEERIEDFGGLQGFVAFLSSEVEATAGEAKEMMRVVFILGDEEVGAIVGLFRLVERGPRVGVEAGVEGPARDGESGAICRREVLGNQHPKVVWQTGDERFARWPVVAAIETIGVAVGLRKFKSIHREPIPRGTGAETHVEVLYANGMNDRSVIERFT